MFKITGDIVEWDGQPVMVLRQDIPATLRAVVTEACEEPEIEEDHTECDAEMKGLESELIEKENECEELAQLLIDAEKQRDTYMAILGIKQ